MTLKQAMLTVVLCFIAVCVALPLFTARIEHIQKAEVRRGEIYTLFLNNYATTLTVFTEHGKPLIMDIERTRLTLPHQETAVIFQRMELKK